MSLNTLGIIGICVLLIIFFLRMPIGLAMALVGFVGLSLIKGLESGLTTLAIVPVRWSSIYMISAIPFFVLMGYLAANIGLTKDAFYVANKWFGHIKGGLAISCEMGGAVFGAVCGDIIAAAVTMCTVALPEMRRYNYDDKLSLGCIAAGGNLSFLIPPSLGFVVYALLTEMSIGELFMAGILPGLLMTTLFIITIIIQCKFIPNLASAGLKSSWRDRIGSLSHAWGFTVLILLVLGGIYGGIFTATEAAACGVFGAAILGLINRQLTLHALTSSITESLKLTGMIFIMIIGAWVFNTFMAVTEIPIGLASYVAQLQLSPYIILAVVLLFFILMGFIIDVMAVIMLVVPIIHPVLVNLGFDPLLLGVLTVVTIIMGHISPPFGVVVFALAGVVLDVPMWTIFRGALPFLFAMFVGLVILVLFPEISTFLPHIMK